METLGLFLLKSVVVSGLLATWYMLALRGRRLHQYNRFFLLSTLFASVVIPFLHFRLFSLPHTVSGGLAPVSRLIQSAGDLGSNIATQQVQHAQADWTTITAIVIILVSLVLFTILSARILRVLRMCRQAAVSREQGVNLVLIDSPRAPFTFLKYLFWNKAMPLDGEVGRLIFRHELAHIEQGHTYDKLFCQVLTCIFWVNPFYWIIQKELNIIHEFIADEKAVADRDTEAFALMLLQSYNNGSYLVPQHYFSSSPVKRRLLMLQNSTKPSYSTLRRFMVLPLIAGTILLCSFNRNAALTHIAPAKKKIVLLLDAGHGGHDAGEQAGTYTEKDICLRYARRIKELAPAYNVEVQLTRDGDKDMPLADRVARANRLHPDLFISLHMSEETGKEKSKGDFDIYVSGKNAAAIQSSNYSSAIFQAMTDDAIIPGIPRGCTHNHDQACTNCVAASIRAAENAGISPSRKESIYVLAHTPAPGMVMILGNIKNQQAMQQLTDDTKVDVLCNAILKGIVDGASPKDHININVAQYIMDKGNGDRWLGQNNTGNSKCN